MDTITDRASLTAEAEALSRQVILVQTNQGTYGAAEAGRKCGTGDPRFADCNVYVEVGTGNKTVDGPTGKRMPGYLRDVGREELSRARARLADLHRQLRGG